MIFLHRPLPGSSISISVSNNNTAMNTINHVDIPDSSVPVTKRRGRKQRKKLQLHHQILKLKIKDLS